MVYENCALWLPRVDSYLCETSENNRARWEIRETNKIFLRGVCFPLVVMQILESTIDISQHVSTTSSLQYSRVAEFRVVKINVVKLFDFRWLSQYHVTLIDRVFNTMLTVVINWKFGHFLTAAGHRRPRFCPEYYCQFFATDEGRRPFPPRVIPSSYLPALRLLLKKFSLVLLLWRT
jgi:hypothetical protein